MDIGTVIFLNYCWAYVCIPSLLTVVKRMRKIKNEKKIPTNNG